MSTVWRCNSSGINVSSCIHRDAHVTPPQSVMCTVRVSITWLATVRLYKTPLNHWGYHLHYWVCVFACECAELRSNVRSGRYDITHFDIQRFFLPFQNKTNPVTTITSDCHFRFEISKTQTLIKEKFFFQSALPSIWTQKLLSTIVPGRTIFHIYLWVDKLLIKFMHF